MALFVNSNLALLLKLPNLSANSLRKKALAGKFSNEHDYFPSCIEDGNNIDRDTWSRRCSSYLASSAAHFFARAARRLFPDIHLGVGPAIEDGFYYDTDHTQAGKLQTKIFLVSKKKWRKSWKKTSHQFVKKWHKGSKREKSSKTIHTNWNWLKSTRRWGFDHLPSRWIRRSLPWPTCPINWSHPNLPPS